MAEPWTLRVALGYPASLAVPCARLVVLAMSWPAQSAAGQGLVFVLVGLGTRIFAALMLAGVAGFLAFFRFGPFSPFLEGHFGFYGDRDVFLAVLCLLLVLLGAGGWSVDANMRRRRKSAAKPE